MKGLILILFCFITTSHLLAQDKQAIDSLLKDLNKQTADTAKMKTLSELVFSYAQNNPSQALTYANQQKILADKVNIPKFNANALNDLAIANFYLGKFTEALSYNKAALGIRESLGNNALVVSSLNKIAIIYQEIGNYDTAAVYQFKILKLAKTLNDSGFIGKTYNNLALIFINLKNYKQAKFYASQGIFIGQKINDNYTTAGGYGNMASNFDSQNIFDSAKYFYNKSLQLFIEEKDVAAQATIYNNLGVIFRKQQNNVDGLAAYQKAYSIATEIKNENDKAQYSANIGQVLVEMKQYQNAHKYLTDAVAVAKPIHNWETLKTAYNALSIYHFVLQKTDSGYYYKNLCDAVSDSLYSTASAKQINGIQTKYDFEKKENDVALLGKENTIQKLIINKNKIYLGMALGLLLASICIAYFILNKNKVRQALKMQEAIFQQQNIATKGILDAEENERKRIAADLHDGIGQTMSVAKMNLSGIESRLNFKDVNDKIAFEKIVNLIDESCKEVRMVSHNMMPNTLLKRGLSSAVKEFIDRIDNRILKVNVYSLGLNEKIEANTETVLYRVIQESVNNVIKHAHATSLDISLIKEDDTISVTIEDDGKGFNMAELKENEGIGLKSIQSRIAFLNGTVEWDTKIGKGTLVVINILIPKSLSL